jgi:hypothetical protein
MTSCSVTSFKKAISSVQGRFCADSNSEKLDPLVQSRRPSKVSGHSLVSNIRSDGVAIPSGSLSVSRRFELFNLASIRMFQQHVQTLFRVLEKWSVQVHPPGPRGNTVRTPVNV